MRKLLPFVLIGVCCGFTAGQTIEWLTKSGDPVIEIVSGAEKIHLGLRSDGVVVWRKITVVTNSPAEKVPVEEGLILVPGGTNIWFNTNHFLVPRRHSITNVILKP